MGIYAVGANYDGCDVSGSFIANNIAGPGWSEAEAPDLWQLMRSLEVGDIMYIKSCNVTSPITVKAIGIIVDDQIVVIPPPNNIVSIGRNVKWVVKNSFITPRPVNEKSSVRFNTIYREFHPDVQSQVLAKLFPIGSS